LILLNKDSLATKLLFSGQIHKAIPAPEVAQKMDLLMRATMYQVVMVD